MLISNKFPFLIEIRWVINNALKILLSKWKYSVYERHQIIFEMINFSLGNQPKLGTLTHKNLQRTNFYILDNLLGISWVDSSLVPILNPGNVLDYFSERSNPFYDRTCNNEVVKMQRLTLEHLK